MAPHFLVLTYPAQGHINPALHFARRLARTGVPVTFTSTVFAHRCMLETNPSPDDLLSYTPFSDGYDDGFDFDKEGEQFMANLSTVGPVAVSGLLSTFAREGRPVTCVVYTFLLSWAAEVAHDVAIPSSLLWIQPALVFAIYHHIFHGGCKPLLAAENKSASQMIELPGLPIQLTYQELPSFILPSDSYPFVLTAIKSLFQTLDKEKKPQVLLNTFDALEPDALKAVDAVQMAGIGPLIPSTFQGSSGSALLQNSRRVKEDYLEWLDSKPRSSVVYVSFGTLAVLPKADVTEILNGLLGSGRPFLWVVRERQRETCRDVYDSAGFSGQGFLVPWCSQVEVLSHPSVGCFVTHCGWNSTLEGLAWGVPMVCFPQWSDQLINAKLIEDVWRMGVRMTVRDDGLLEGGELKRCLEAVMEGESGKQKTRNAKEWREMAREAVGNGGSSDRNLKAFADGICSGDFC